MIMISSVGYRPQEVKITNQATVSVSLQIEVSGLEDVVVTGYIAQKKKEITGSVSVVNVSDMKQMPVGTGEEALQGRAPGVTIISSAQPGAASDIYIRGITAFGNNAPLIIVDGVRGNLHDINTNDIESLQVLKDATAAIYGVAGSNGVIIITTRKGKSGKAKVTYDFYYGVTTRGAGYDMASTQEEADAEWLQQRNSGIANPSSKQFGNGANPVIPDYITPYGSLEGAPGTDPSTYDINTNQITRANKTGTNWYDVITRNAPTENHNLTVSSGSDKSSYFFSMGYLNEQGIAKFQYLKRYSVRANTQFTIKDKIRIGENAYIFYKQNPIYFNQSDGSPFFGAFREPVIIPVHDIVGNYAGTKSEDLGLATNPYAGIERTKDNRTNNWDITGNVYAEADFLKHFTARTNFGGIIVQSYDYSFGFVGYENHEGNTGLNSFSESASYNSQWTFNNTITYNNAFADHNVKVLLGTEAVKYYVRNSGANRSSYFSENPDFWVVEAGTGVQANWGNAYESTLWSQFARLEYGYDGKYLINGSLRKDGSSVFAEDVRHGYFPAFSAGWILSRENFFRNVTFVNNLKLRFSWGKLGSTSNVQPTNPYNLYSSRLGRSSYDIRGTSNSVADGFYRSYIGNAATTWEGDIISNIGLDVTLFGNKLDFTIDVYKKKISGLLFEQGGVATSVVFSADPALPKVNIGDMQNTGIDFNATYHARADNLKLDITGIFTTYNNEIVDLPGLAYRPGDFVGFTATIPQRYQEGHPFGAFFGYNVLGIFQSEEEVAKSPKQSGGQPGVFKYQDLNSDDTINADDRTFLGDPNPDFTYGLNISAEFKNFDFSAFFFGSHGNAIFNSTLYYTDFLDFKGAIRREVAVNSWTPSNTNTKIPKLLTVGVFSTNQTGYASSYFLSNGSYLRCKQIQIGYTFPKRLLSKFEIDRLRIYVQGTNVFTITKYEGLDPELQSQNIARSSQYGIDQGNYPHTPAYLFGINLNF
jgi:TonB-linked SusC/RagA family outer membrane protein